MFYFFGLWILLLATTSAQGGLSEQQPGGWEEAPALMFRGARLRCFSNSEVRVVEPYIAMRLPRRGVDIRPDPLGQGFFMTVPLVVESGVKLPADGTRKWELLNVHGFQVAIRKSIGGACASSCPSVTVSGRWNRGHHPVVTFRCRSRAACLGLKRALRFTGPDHAELLGSLRFTFHGKANGQSFVLSRVGLPVANAVKRPFKNAFWFESDKLLLYTVKANSGHQAYPTYQNEQTYAVPRDGSLPSIYRSGLLDQLAQVAKSGRWQIVAEMRDEAGRTVSQAVFSAEPESLDKNSWFSPERLLSTKPYWFGRSNYNIFGIAGDDRGASLLRRFQINRHYGGCEKDAGLFYVSDVRDPCTYSNRGWKGKSPLLVYSPLDGKPYHQDNVAYADRFLVYLRLETPVLPLFAVSRKALPGAFTFESGKVLLFTVKAGSGHPAVATFLNRQPAFSKATTGSLPDVYRSDLIDSLSQAVIATGRQYLVAEMRVADRMVAQVVFDVSVRRQSLDKQNWFHQSRVVSSYPYRAVRELKHSDGFYHNPDVADPRFQTFSVVGDTHWKRGFFILYSYAGCPGDRAFWTVSDARDPCAWGNSGWPGKAPALVYTESQASALQAGGAKFADRFLIYLK